MPIFKHYMNSRLTEMLKDDIIKKEMDLDKVLLSSGIDVPKVISKLILEFAKELTLIESLIELTTVDNEDYFRLILEDTNLLEVASKKGIIDSFSKQNAENLDFENDTFDYVLIKESLHHLPRPWLALYESFRDCKKGVIVIEPNDPFPYGNLFRILFIKFKNIYKRFFY